jgi:hypothetical protein
MKGTKMVQDIKKHEVEKCIYVFDDAIKNSKEIFDLSLSKNEWLDAAIVSVGDVQYDLYHGSRSANILEVMPTVKIEPQWFFLLKDMWDVVKKVSEEWFVEINQVEALHVLRYKKDEGFYKEHADIGSGLPRVFTGIVFLNEIEEGGEIIFPKHNLSISPKPGRMVVFPSNFLYRYEVTTPSSDDLITVSSWFLE